MAVSFTPTVVSNPQGVQGSYLQRMTLGQEGALSNLRDYSTETARNQAGAVIPFGVPVATDNTPTSNEVNAVDLAGGPTLIQGLALMANIFEGNDESAYVARSGQYPGSALAADGRLGYPNLQTITLLRRGVIWVYSTSAIAIGDAVKFFKADHSGTIANAFQGRFTKTAAANVTITVATGASWRSETAGNGLVELAIDFSATTFTADT